MSARADHPRAGSPGPDDGDESVFEDLVEELTDRLQAGDAVDVEDFLARHPAQAERLRRLIPSLELMDDLGQWSIREGNRVGPPPADPAAGLGELGDFRLIREVGRGGMGIVYEAEQVSLGRRVALKLLPMAAAMDPRQIQRFRVEAQAAACLHHPHIVPVHGVGCERGVHYYAMQLIDGRSLAAMIADLRRLDGLNPADGLAADLSAIATSDLAARLLTGGAAGGPGRAGSDSPTVAHPTNDSAPANPTPEEPPAARTASSGSSTRNRHYVRNVARLALQAAEALDHAHTRGILHRDIKPANLLLDAEGRLWVTDFGLAQVRGDDRLTLTGDVLGTLRYMSPEQALGRRVAIDGRTDVYSLGVTLYELLTLRPAVDGHDRAEILRRIADGEPSPLRKVNPAVPADLETIVLKAMAKEPAIRYATAQELAEDLGSFLADRPIRARRPGVLDRAGKWSRRHRAVMMTTAVMLVLGTAVSTWEAIRATRAERAALQHRQTADNARDAEAGARQQAEAAEAAARVEADKATAINDFLTNDLLVQANPRKNAPSQRVTLREVLDRAADRVGSRFRDRPLVEAALRCTLGETYLHLGEHDKSRGQFTAALEICQREKGPGALETARALVGLGQALGFQGENSRAELLLRRGLEVRRRALGEEHPDTVWTMLCLGAQLVPQGKLEDAETLLAETLDIGRRALGEEHPHTLWTMTNLASCHTAQGKLAQAQRLALESMRIIESMRIRRRAFAEDDLIDQYAMEILVGICLHQGRLSEAERIATRMLEVVRRFTGEEHGEQALHALSRLAFIYEAQGKLPEAERLLPEILAIRRRTPLADAWELSGILARLSYIRLRQRRAAEAEPLARECLAIRDRELPDHWLRYNAMSLLGGALLGQARYSEAEPLLLASYEGMRARAATIPPQGGTRLPEARERIVQLYEAWGQPEKAATWRAKLGLADLPADVFARP